MIFFLITNRLNFIEIFSFRDNLNGHECVLRAICEVAETPLGHNGLIGEVLQILFSPNDEEKLDSDYKFARKVGLNGGDCTKTYSDCPIGAGILDGVTLIEEFNKFI